MRRDGTEAQVPGEGDQEGRNPNAGKFLSSLIQSVLDESFASSDRSDQLATLLSDYCNSVISSYYFFTFKYYTLELRNSVLSKKYQAKSVISAVTYELMQPH